jgi:hypothetical protein
MQNKLKNKPGAEKWKRLVTMINEVTNRDHLSFNELKEIFSIGYEIYKHKKGVMKNGRSVIKRYKSSVCPPG